MILKMIVKSFEFQCDFDFQITTSKMILILNHLYLGDLILKSSTYDDFAHLCLYNTFIKSFVWAIVPPAKYKLINN